MRIFPRNTRVDEMKNKHDEWEKKFAISINQEKQFDSGSNGSLTRQRRRYKLVARKFKNLRVTSPRYLSTQPARRFPIQIDLQTSHRSCCIAVTNWSPKPFRRYRDNGSGVNHSSRARATRFFPKQ